MQTMKIIFDRTPSCSISYTMLWCFCSVADMTLCTICDSIVTISTHANAASSYIIN